MKGKKGQVGGLPNIVLIIIFALLMLAVGFFLVQEILDLDNLERTDTVTNETDGWLNQTAYTVNAAFLSGFSDFTLTALWNTSSDTTIPLANATTTTTGTVTSADYHYNSTDVQYSYTYTFGGNTYEGVNETLEAFLTIPQLIGLVILVIMIGIIIAILTGIMPTGKVGTGA